MKSHKDLDVWQDSVELVLLVYRITQQFPKEELFGLTGQMRRASVSVSANISEGAAKNQTKEFIRFLRIALGSLSEIETLVIITHKLQLVDMVHFEEINGRICKLNKQLSGLIRSLSVMMSK